MDDFNKEGKFPRKGEYFGVEHSNGRDGSYMTDVFLCTGADEDRVVASFVTTSFLSDKPMIFHRKHWIFSDVSALLDALGVNGATAAIGKAAGDAA